MNSDSRPRADKTLAKIVEYGILGLLVFTPLPAASVHEWSILAIQLAVLIMVGAYVLMKDRPQIDNSLAPVIKWLKYTYFAFFVLAVIQLLPLPVGLVRVLSPGAYNFQRLYTADFTKLKFISLSLIPSHTLQSVLELFSYFLLGSLVFMTVRKRHQMLRLWTVIVSVGLFEALYGLFELYNKNPRVLFYKKVYNLDSVTGTFVNRNHLSGYLEMVIPLAIGLLIARIAAHSQSSLTVRDRLLQLEEKGFILNLMVLFAVIVMAIAIIFSKSRSGLSVLIITFVLFFGLATIYFGIFPRQAKWAKNILKTAFLSILIVSLYFGISATLERFSLDDILHEERPTYWAHSIRVFSEYPILGTGLGTFGLLAPNLEGASGPVAMVHAHNDYLEYLSELGTIGFLLLFSGIVYAVIVSFNGWRKRKNPEVKGLALGGIISLISILIHSLTDFNLHIPANGVLFSVVLPMTVITAFYKKGAAPLSNR